MIWLPEFLPASKLKTVVYCFLLIPRFTGSLPFIPSFPFSSFPLVFALVGVAGFEPATLRLSSACSNQLSYTPNGEVMVEAWGFEPQTYSLQSYRSTN